VEAARDRWAIGKAYEPYVGRWSRRVADVFLPWTRAPKRAAWLDVGCGTGALIERILATCSPRSVKGLDPSEGFLALAEENIPDPRVGFAQGDARAIPAPDGVFEVVVSGLVLNFVPEPPKAAAEIARVLKRGGVAAAYVWDYAGGMQMMRHFWNAAAALDPAAREKDEGRRFPLCNPDALRALWTQAGFRHVEVAAIDIETVYRDFDDFWTPFLGGQGPAPTYCMALDDGARERLGKRLRESLPTAVDGSIPLYARAWAVQGRR